MNKNGVRHFIVPEFAEELRESGKGIYDREERLLGVEDDGIRAEEDCFMEGYESAYLEQNDEGLMLEENIDEEGSLKWD